METDNNSRGTISSKEYEEETVAEVETDLAPRSSGGKHPENDVRVAVRPSVCTRNVRTYIYKRERNRERESMLRSAVMLQTAKSMGVRVMDMAVHTEAS